MDYAVKTGAAVSICLSIPLVIILLGLTRPIRALNKAAIEIAGGNYQKRAVIKSHDEIGEFSAIFNDMADHIETHIEELSRITEEKQRFIDNLSHEMRTPIAAILGYAELLRAADIGEEDRLTATDYIISQSLRLQNLSAKLLQLSSMKNDVIKMEPVYISGIIERVQNTLRDLCEEKNITFEMRLNADDMGFVCKQ
jgi:signal transduction histidine kinase